MAYLNMLVDAARYLFNHYQLFVYQQFTHPQFASVATDEGQADLQNWFAGQLHNLDSKHRKIALHKPALRADFLHAASMDELHQALALDLVRELPIILNADQIRQNEEMAQPSDQEQAVANMIDARQSLINDWLEDGVILADKARLMDQFRDMLAENYKQFSAHMYQSLGMGTPTIYMPEHPVLDKQAIRQAQQHVAQYFMLGDNVAPMVAKSFNHVGQCMMQAFDMAVEEPSGSAFCYQFAGRLMAQLGYTFHRTPMTAQSEPEPVGTRTAMVFNELSYVAEGIAMALKGAQHPEYYRLHKMAGCRQIPDPDWPRAYLALSASLAATRDYLREQRDAHSGLYVSERPADPDSFWINTIPLSCH